MAVVVSSASSLKKFVSPDLALPKRGLKLQSFSVHASAQENELESVSLGVSAGEAATAVALVSEDVSTPSSGESDQQEEQGFKVWLWRGLYRIRYTALLDSKGPAVLLIHGFGASIRHYRRTIPVLAGKYSVYALDLLGLGGSEKPPEFPYTIEAWSELVSDFIKEVMNSTPTVLVGNSIGSLVCLTATTYVPEGLIRGVVLLNCAGGMNNKAVVDDWRLKLVTPLLWLIDWLLKQPGISSRLFNRVRSKENLKTVLESVYCNKEAVDEELIEIIQKPAEDPGALEAFVSIVTGPPGPTPMSLMDSISVPVLVLWGDTDPFTPVNGPVGKFFTSLPAARSNVKLYVLSDVGHCPHDDRPELVHEYLLPWLDGL